MNKLFDRLFSRKRVCPWWICFTFDNVLRTLFHDPDQILRPYIMEIFSWLNRKFILQKQILKKQCVWLHKQDLHCTRILRFS